MKYANIHEICKTHISTQGVLEPEELEAVVASKHPPLLALQVREGGRFLLLSKLVALPYVLFVNGLPGVQQAAAAAGAAGAGRLMGAAESLVLRQTTCLLVI